MTGSDGIEKSTVLHFPRSTAEVQLYVAIPSDGTFHLGCSHEIFLSQQPVPRHVARDSSYQFICVHMVCVCLVLCTLNAIQLLTVCNVVKSDGWRAPRCQFYHVCFLGAPLSMCCRTVAKPDGCSVAKSYGCSVAKSYGCSVAKPTAPHYATLSTLTCRLSMCTSRRVFAEANKQLVKRALKATKKAGKEPSQGARRARRRWRSRGGEDSGEEGDIIGGEGA